MAKLPFLSQQKLPTTSLHKRGAAATEDLIRGKERLRWKERGGPFQFRERLQRVLNDRGLRGRGVIFLVYRVCPLHSLKIRFSSQHYFSWTSR